MKKIFATMAFALLTATLPAQQLSVTTPFADTWVMCTASSMSAPMLHTAADIARVKSKLNVSPWKEAYAHLCQSQYAQPTYTEHTDALLDGYLKRMDKNNWSGRYADYSNYTAFMRDAAATYQLGLRYQLGGNTDCADAAVNVLNAWKDNCRGVLKLAGHIDSIPDPNEYLILINVHQMANGAALLLDYKGWKDSDKQAFKAWMKNSFYRLAYRFLTNHQNQQASQHTWLNWDLAAMTSALSIGILCNDKDAINFAIDYFKNEKGVYSENGNIRNAVPYIHQDPDSGEKLGQCQESGRDQGHATLCVSLMGAFCQMAYNTGVDLFAYDDYRALRMAEYVGKYNLYTDDAFQQVSNTQNGFDDSYFQYRSADMPYTAYSNPSNNCPTISTSGRGAKRPAWELFYGYAKAHNLSAIYCQRWVEQMRQYNSYGSDGGGGDYGPNSSGFDQLGYGTLMYAR